MKVLLVEDDASLREGMAELVEELATVRATGGVDEALAALEHERYELVITDLRIGGGERDGRTILEAARSKLQAVAVVSAATPDEVGRTLGTTSPDGLLTKPFQLEDILALVNRFLSLRRAADQAAFGGPRPGCGSWSPLSPGVEVARPSGAEASGYSWVRMGPGASTAWGHRGERHGVVVVEGELTVGGERFSSPHYFFVSAGQHPEARTHAGCLAVCVPLRE
ncbi:response regulator [Corallococcus sp. H22C18031201]|uniref:response regulator n=1 Tax=Citreicoccus inhibens TaxID=2849499 RepID=UPI000E76A82D|nr:response regulator [Citreicoccus inhibens]MBU8894781.1 response regulator [Citreicoccus inhibens]RJS17632.1 response regulator [Corallococcus sp. H22C18031201]